MEKQPRRAGRPATPGDAPAARDPAPADAEHAPADDRGENVAADHAQRGDLADYVSFLRGVPVDNAIARRFNGAAQLLARAVLVHMVFASIRSLGFKWEEAVRRAGEMLGMSRSSVVRMLRDFDDIVAFWNANDYRFIDIDHLVEQISGLAREQHRQALRDEATSAAAAETAKRNSEA